MTVKNATITRPWFHCKNTCCSDPTGHTAVLYRRTGEVWMRYALGIGDILALVSINYRIGLERLFLP